MYSCKHDIYDVQGCGKFNSYEDVKAFCCFNVGTYWVYENQQTLERDTITVFALDIGYNGGQEVGFWTQMNRTYESANWTYFHNGNNNVFPPDNNCELMRVFMTRSEINESGEATNFEESKLLFPFRESGTYFSPCGDIGDDGLQLSVTNRTILDYSEIPSITIESSGFSMNPCNGDNYRYQFGRGIGLVYWENLDAMDGRWELIEFEIP